MYAQLCKRLSEEAPNLEPPGQPCTFKLLLLNKCRTEFENRAQAFAAFEDKALSPEEEEKRHLAKCKMLGNIKFIGELGKLEILAESILHRCIQNLLARRAAAEHHEDLECLAQLVRTCGRVLDSERGRGLMEQYFSRIETLAGSRELAPRLRFMLRDVAELRRGGWVPRAAVSSEGPVPIHQLRPDASPVRREREPPFRSGLRARPLDDVLAGLALPAAAPPGDKLFGNGYPRDYRQRSAPGYFPHARHKPLPAPPSAPHSAAHRGDHKEARTPKSRVYAAGAAALADVQMRPAANSLLFTANRLSRPAPPAQQIPNVLAPAFAHAAPLLSEPAIAIKPSDKRDKKDKGVNKDEAIRLGVEAVAQTEAAWPEAAREPPAPDFEPAADAAPALLRLRALDPPDKVMRRVVAAALDAGLEPAGGERRAWAACCVARALRRPGAHLDLLRGAGAAGAGGGDEAARAQAGALLAHAARLRLVAPAELAAAVPAPLMLPVLQHLHRLLGAPQLQRLLQTAKLDVCAYVTEQEGGVEPALAALEARGLEGLAPQLRVQAQLARQLAQEPQPTALYRWIKNNVEASVRGNAAFVSTLVALVAAHVTRAAGADGGGAGGGAGGGGAGGPDKAALERERALLEPYAPLLTALLHARPDLQLAAVYALQVHAHQHRYPKGMLLRWFMYLYNLEVCEEEAFLRWREHVTDAYPGKGEALFQVNAWLTWLQQQDSEDDDADD